MLNFLFDYIYFDVFWEYVLYLFKKPSFGESSIHAYRGPWISTRTTMLLVLVFKANFFLFVWKIINCNTYQSIAWRTNSKARSRQLWYFFVGKVWNFYLALMYVCKFSENCDVLSDNGEASQFFFSLIITYGFGVPSWKNLDYFQSFTCPVQSLKWNIFLGNFQLRFHLSLQYDFLVAGGDITA